MCIKVRASATRHALWTLLARLLWIWVKSLLHSRFFEWGVDADGSEADGQPDYDFQINPRRAIESSEPARSDALQPSFQQVRPSRPTARSLKRIAPADNYAYETGEPHQFANVVGRASA